MVEGQENKPLAKINEIPKFNGSRFSTLNEELLCVMSDSSIIGKED